MVQRVILGHGLFEMLLYKTFDVFRCVTVKSVRAIIGPGGIH